MTGARGEELNINISNAGEGSFPTAWPNYHACASYDRKYWFRVPSSYDKESGVLSWKHTPEHVSSTSLHAGTCPSLTALTPPLHMPPEDCIHSLCICSSWPPAFPASLLTMTTSAAAWRSLRA